MVLVRVWMLSRRNQETDSLAFTCLESTRARTSTTAFQAPKCGRPRHQGCCKTIRRPKSLFGGPGCLYRCTTRHTLLRKTASLSSYTLHFGLSKRVFILACIETSYFKHNTARKRRTVTAFPIVFGSSTCSEKNMCGAALSETCAAQQCQTGLLKASLGDTAPAGLLWKKCECSQDTTQAGFFREVMRCQNAAALMLMLVKAPQVETSEFALPPRSQQPYRHAASIRSTARCVHYCRPMINTPHPFKGP